MSEQATMIWLHVIAATPPTIAAVAALVKASRAERHTRAILVKVNGRIDALTSELELARQALARKDAS